MVQIGAYEAKTHLPRLLDRVSRGESLTITRHGKPVARLVPVAGERERAKEAAARIVEGRQAPQACAAGRPDRNDTRRTPILTAIVIDNSVFLSWCLGDEDDPTAAQAMQRVAEEGGVAPRIWWYELRNALLMNERRGRLSLQQVSDTLDDSLELGIAIDDEHDGSLLLDLARGHGLTAYDAAYLEVAVRRSLPLATLDRRLRGAAEAIGVSNSF